MFFFSKKTTIAASGILQGATDHHSHILPGVDDGVETMDEALRILATYEAAGVKTLWLTPHIMEDIPNTPQKLEARFLELKAAYTGSIELHLAAEYMIDNHLRKLLQNHSHSSTGAVQPEPFQQTPPHFRGEVVEDRRGEISHYQLRHSSTRAVQPEPFQQTPPRFRGEVVEDRRGEISHYQFRPASTGAVQPEPFQQTPPHFRGEVVEDRRGEEKTKECPQGSIVNPSEVTEGSKTKNCPACVRGTSITSDAEGVELRPASEGRWHEQSELTEGSNNKLLPIGSKGNHLLVETSYYNPPMRFRETLRQIKSLGYHPLLAHPERYMYMDNDEYRELHNEGVRFQLNLPSLCGAYGNTVKKRAQWLLKNGLYDAIGSDTHCEEGAKFLMEGKIEEKHITALQMLKNSII